eukprot:329275_1
MASQTNVPLIIRSDKQDDEAEVMLTTYGGGTKDTTTKTKDYNSIHDDETKILLPGDEMMLREEVPLYPTYYYVIFYLFVCGAPFLLSYLSYLYVDDVDWEEYVTQMIGIGLG